MDVITTPGVRKGRNGQEDADCQNTYIITSAGEMLFTQSVGIAHSINSLLAMMPDLQKHVDENGEVHGVPVRICAFTMPNGNTFKQLALV